MGHNKAEAAWTRDCSDPHSSAMHNFSKASPPHILTLTRGNIIGPVWLSVFLSVSVLTANPFDLRPQFFPSLCQKGTTEIGKKLVFDLPITSKCIGSYLVSFLGN